MAVSNSGRSCGLRRGASTVAELVFPGDRDQQTAQIAAGVVTDGGGKAQGGRRLGRQAMGARTAYLT
jgi:hypothetical protein